VASQLKQARIDFQRAKSLKEQGVVSAEQYDQAETGLRIAVADEALAEHQLTQAEAALGSQYDDHSHYDRPVVKQAEAALEAAKLDLDYTKLTAPFAGVVTHKSAHAGNRVQVGEPLLAIVPLRKLYVTANFKETQLTDVRVGQKAEIVADIYPGYTYQGHVDSISMGTGAAFSLLPPENATGNWVKVVQRVPVKIVIDGAVPEDKPLRLGLSVEVAIDLGDRSGPLLSSLVQQHYQKDGQTMPNESLQMAPMPPSQTEPSQTQPSQDQRSLQLPH
jgi:membrane fusion protein, multidrug efflux system